MALDIKSSQTRQYIGIGGDDLFDRVLLRDETLLDCPSSSPLLTHNLLLYSMLSKTKEAEPHDQYQCTLMMT